MSAKDICNLAQNLLGVDRLHPSDYKWVLGIRLCRELSTMPYSETVSFNNPTECVQFLGIDVVPDYRNPYRLELWRKVGGV